jgi:hypothetical protein
VAVVVVLVVLLVVLLVVVVDRVVVVVVARVVVVVLVVVVVPPPPGVPVHAVPFRVKPPGVPGVPEPWKPKVAVPFVASPPFQLAFVAVTADPDWVTVAFQAELTVSPPPKFQVSVHPETASPRFVTSTEATKPPGHWEVTAYVAWQPVAAWAGALATEAVAVTARQRRARR